MPVRQIVPPLPIPPSPASRARLKRPYRMVHFEASVPEATEAQGLFGCGLCGGEVVMFAGRGRLRQHLRGVFLEIPADFRIPTCTECGEEWMDPATANELDKQLARVSRAGSVQRTPLETITTRELAMVAMRAYLDGRCSCGASVVSAPTHTKIKRR